MIQEKKGRTNDSLPTAAVLRTFLQYSIVPDKAVKFRDTRLNISPEIQPETVGGHIFYSSDNFRPDI